MNTSDDSYNKIFVGNIPYQCTDEEFIDCFKNYEGFKHAELIYRHNTKLTRGFGFVSFETLSQIQKLINETNIKLKDRDLRLSSYSTKVPVATVDDSKPSKVFLRNITPEMDESNISAVFSYYGEVTNCEINKNRHTGERTNTAVIEFKNNDSFDRALKDKVKNVNGPSL